MRLVFVISVSFWSSFLVAQQKNISLNKQFSTWEETALNRVDNPVHSGMRPILESNLYMDSLKLVYDFRLKRKKRTKLIGKKLKSESFIQLKGENYSFTIDPILQMEYGKEQSLFPDTTTLYRNTRGIIVQADILKKVSFSTSFYETQAFFPSYISQYGHQISEDPLYPQYGIAPSEGRAKSFKNGGYDYGVSTAYVSYSPSSYLNIQFGHGKNFIGEGYRSLLLSDNAINYPFLKISAQFGKNKKWQYTNIFNSLLSSQRVPTTISTEQQYKRKAGSFHYLSWIPLKRLQIGLFEGTIWKTWDDSTGSVPFNYAQINPVIGGNTLSNKFDSENNTVLGLNIKYTPINYTSLYGQLLYNGTAKKGLQAGIKVYDFAGLVKNLSIRLEYNYTSKNTYTFSNPLQSYNNFGQPLAHPLGGGFKEYLGIINYNFRDFFIQAQYLSAKIGNEFNCDFCDATTDVLPTPPSNLTYIDLQIGYMVNPISKLNVAIGVKYRNLSAPTSVSNSKYVYFALRTSLQNLYYDF